MSKAPQLKRLSREDFVGLSPDVMAGVDKLIYALNPFLSDVTAGLNRGLSFQENFAAVVKDVEFTVPDDWMPVQLLNGFSQAGSPDFPKVPAIRKADDGMVYVRGLLQRSSTPSGYTDILMMPSSYAPETGLYALARCFDGAGSVVALPGGTLQWRSGSTVSFSLDQVQWMAADRRPPAFPAPFPLILNVDELPAAPSGCVVLRCLDITDKQIQPAPSPGIVWEPSTADSKKVLRLLRVQGLAVGRKYRVTLFVAG